MISATLRLRLKPCRPVEQNEHSSAQPACEEMHSVPREVSGMKTVPIALFVPTSSSHLRVPSAATLSRRTLGGAMTAVSARRSRNALEMSVMAAKSAAPAWCIQRRSCFAR